MMQGVGTVLCKAAREGHKDIVLQLLDRGADVNAEGEVSNVERVVKT